MILWAYVRKMRGSTQGLPPRVNNQEILWSWVGALLGISAVSLADRLLLSGSDLSLMIGSFGASAVLLYGAVRSPLAQPRNVIGGHIVSAAVGVLCWQMLHDIPDLAAAMAVASAIAAMHFTRTLHPPGGATALIAVIGGDNIHHLGFTYVVIPVALGAAILLVIALLINNVPATRRYPEVWF